MTPDQAENFRYNVLDLTKVWPHGEYPLRPIGRLVLNENPQNYFAEIEQVRSPSTIGLLVLTSLMARLHFLLRTWSLTLSLPPIPCCSPACSLIPTPTVIGWASTTSNFLLMRP